MPPSQFSAKSKNDDSTHFFN